jgi:hypothetical protein
VVTKKVLWVSLETSLEAIAAIEADADPLQEAVLGAVGVAEVVGDGLGASHALVELKDSEQSGISGELAWRWLDHQRRAEEDS